MQRDLKRKLKAADRRRRRRPAKPAVSAPAERPSAGADATELITSAILSYVDDSSATVQDPAVVAALRSTLHGLVASGDQSGALCERFKQIAHRDDVDQRSYRVALKQLMDSAKEHQDPKDRQAFIRYLSLLSS